MSANSSFIREDRLVNDLDEVEEKLNDFCNKETEKENIEVIHILDAIFNISDETISETLNKIKEYNKSNEYFKKCITMALKLRPKQEKNLQTLYYNLFKKSLFSQPERDDEKNKIREILINDDVEEFIKFSSQPGFDPNVTFSFFSHDTLFFMIKTILGANDSAFHVDITLMQFMAMFGAIKCFKYALIDGSYDKSNLSPFAVAGGNNEIIGLLEKENVSFDICFEISVIFHRNKISNWLLMNYKCKEMSPAKALDFFNHRAFFFLLKNGGKIDANELFPLLIKKESLAMIKYLVEEYHPEFDEENYKESSQEMRDYFKSRYALHEACESGDLNDVKRLIEEEHFYYDHKINGKTPLHVASNNGKVEIINYLIKECKANVDEVDTNGATPIFYATLGGNFEAVKLLATECSAQVNIATNNQMTPVLLASKLGHLEILKFLVEECGGDVSQRDIHQETALHHATSNNNLDVVQYLIKNNLAEIDAKDNDEMTALHIACDNMYKEIVKFLIEEGHANVNEKDGKGRTLFFICCMRNNLEVAQFLFREMHAFATGTDSKGRTVLHAACRNNNIDLVKFLIDETEANVNEKDAKGRTPFFVSCVKNNLEVAQFLFREKHAFAKESDLKGTTALHVACINKNIEMVDFLIKETKANVNENDNVKRCPLIIAIKDKNLELVKYLVEEGHASFTIEMIRNADDDIKKYFNSRKLIYRESKAGNIEKMKKLLENNIFVDQKYDGKTALKVAIDNNKIDMVKYLVEECNASFNKSDISKANKSIKEYFNQRIELFNASEKGDIQTVKRLIEEEKYIPNQKYNGSTALHVACASKNDVKDVVSYLVEICNVNEEDQNEKTPLILASESGNIDALKCLIEKGKADLSIRDKYERTALHVATINNRLSIIKYLVEDIHMNVEDVDKGGKNVIYFAKKNEKEEILDYFSHINE